MPDDIPLAPPVEVTAAEPRAIDMVHDLHRAIHGDSWAKAQSPREVWDELLAHVEGMAAGRCHVCITKDVRPAAPTYNKAGNPDAKGKP